MGMKFSCWIVMIACYGLGQAGASPTAAMRIQKSWEAKNTEWNLRLKSAAGDEQRARVLAEMPDVKPSLEEMWKVIGGSLDKEWALEPAAWFLRANQRANPSLMAKESAQIRKAVEAHHLKSAALLSVCVAMAECPDPLSLAVLEKIVTSNPDPKIQGAAAMGSALLLGKLGDDPGIMQRRLTYLRKAIIQSSGVDFGGKPVAEMAKDELYVINHLTKGRTAPDLTGVDSAGRSLRLSDFNGKVVYLLFWSSTMPERERILRMVGETKTRHAGKPLEIVGINLDPLATLRGMEADGSVPWRNFSDVAGALSGEYRVAALPTVFVLDKERKVQYVGMPGSFADLTCDALLSE